MPEVVKHHHHVALCQLVPWQQLTQGHIVVMLLLHTLNMQMISCDDVYAKVVRDESPCMSCPEATGPDHKLRCIGVRSSWSQ